MKGGQMGSSQGFFQYGRIDGDRSGGRDVDILEAFHKRLVEIIENDPRIVIDNNLWDAYYLGFIEINPNAT